MRVARKDGKIGSGRPWLQKSLFLITGLLAIPVLFYTPNLLGNSTALAFGYGGVVFVPPPPSFPPPEAPPEEKPPEEKPPCVSDALRTDIYHDGKINILDFNLLMTDWIKPAEGNSADINSDGAIDVWDFNLMMIDWGKTKEALRTNIFSDRKIDIFDFNLIMVNWNNPAENNPADVDGDGKIDIKDFNQLVVDWDKRIVDYCYAAEEPPAPLVVNEPLTPEDVVYLPKESTRILQYTSANDPLTPEAAAIRQSAKNKAAELNRVIDMPSINVSSLVLELSNLAPLLRETWILPWGSTPDKGGNTVIVGHSFNRRGGRQWPNLLFNLKDIKNGDLIVLKRDGKKYTYRVFDNRRFAPENGWLENNTEQAILTLYSCGQYITTFRQVVRAELVNVTPPLK